MPRKPAQQNTDEEKLANKGISEVIYYFYTQYKQTKPDATHFKQNHNLMKALMFPSDEYRTYSVDEIKNVIKELYLNGVVLMSLTILSWPDLCRAIVDNDTHTSKQIMSSIKKSQAKDGIYAENIAIPKGW